MNVITIPQKLAKKDDLVVIPRKEYEELLEFKKIRGFIPTVKMTRAQKRDLAQAREEYKKGEYITLEQLKRGLGVTHKKTR